MNGLLVVLPKTFMSRFNDVTNGRFNTPLIRGAKILICSALAFWILALWYTSEPMQDGKSLSHWLGQLHSINSVEKARAEKALREIGEKAVPVLTRWISHNDYPVKKRFIAWLKELGVSQRDWPDENYYHAKALSGFKFLGSDADSALPELRQMLQQPKLAHDAAFAILFVSPREAEKLARTWTSGTNRHFQGIGLRIKQAMEELTVESEL